MTNGPVVPPTTTTVASLTVSTDPGNTGSRYRVKRWYVKKKTRDCMADQSGKITLVYAQGSSTTFQFDLDDDAIPCSGSESAYRALATYLCVLPDGYPKHSELDAFCPSWERVLWSTDPAYVTNYRLFHHLGLQSKISIVQGSIGPTSSKHRDNPLLLSISGLDASPFTSRYFPSYCTFPASNEFYLAIGVDVSGKDPIRLIKISIVPPTTPSLTLSLTTRSPISRRYPVPNQVASSIVSYDSGSLSPQEAINVATGHAALNPNSWLELAHTAAVTSGKSDCVVCMGPRTLLTLALTSFDQYPANFSQCALLAMSKTSLPPLCAAIDAYYPLAPATQIPPTFSTRIPYLNFTCYERNKTSRPVAMVGYFPSPRCSSVVLVHESLATKLSVARSDIWWFVVALPCTTSCSLPGLVVVC